MDYTEFKERICDFLNLEYSKDENYFKMKIGEDELNFCEEDLEDTFNELGNKTFEQGVMFDNNNYEVILIEEDFRAHRQLEIIKDNEIVTDEDNKYSYEISEFSKLLKVYLVYILLEEQKNCNDLKEKRILRRNSRIFQNYTHSRRFARQSEESTHSLTMDDLFSMITKRYFSLKISSESPLNLKQFDNLKNSFLFNCMYTMDFSIVEYHDFASFLYYNRQSSRISYTEGIEPPKRIYNSDIISFYKKAVASTDPYVQFISYYHILEYFYDEVYYRHLVNDMRKEITDPSFSYKRDDKLIELANFTMKRLKQFGEDGQGNEFESLKYVLEEFIDVSELKKNIDEKDSELINYYSQKKVPFSEGNVLRFSDKRCIIDIAKRIYYTRNSLVHSKSGKKNLTYHPYKHENHLMKEIPLLKHISEMIIINSSEYI